MQIVAQKANASKPDRKEEGKVLTTLYELIAALNKQVHPEQDWIVTDAVLDLF